MNKARHSISLKYFLMKNGCCAKIDGTEVFYVKQCKPVRQMLYVLHIEKLKVFT